MTTIVLGYRSALSYWSTPNLRNRSMPLTPLEEQTALAEAAIPLQHHVAKLIETGTHKGIEAPIDAIVPILGASRRAPFMQVHTQTSTLPSGSLMFLDAIPCNGETLTVYVSSPELCLVQMGCLMERHELAELAFELCGDYALRPGRGNAAQIVERPHVTTAKQIKAFTDQADGVRGIRRARHAAENVLDGSRSPRESQIALEMTLSHRLGGYGLPCPILNEPITPKGLARRAAGRNAIIPDFYWSDAKIALEYDSEAFHAGKTEREHDLLKHNAYEMMGIRTLTMSNRQYVDQLQFTCIMNELSKRLGCELHHLTALQERKRAQLHGFLTHGDRLTRK